MTSKNDGPEIEMLEGSRDPVDRSLPRRKVLGALAIAGVAPALQDGGNQSDGDETGSGETDGDGEAETHFELGGEVDGWQGQSPSEIEGETNPTLDLEAGARYMVTWENLDGVQHNFTILDADGTPVTDTEITSVQGETLSLTFTATEEMDQYYCAIHTDVMRGDIQIGDGGPTEDEPTEDGEEAEDVETRFELGGAIGGWQGSLPEERDHENYIEGEENPTLELEAGARYMVTWENLDDVTHDFTIRDADGNGLIATEVAFNQGERRSLTFTATEEMDHYVCTFHLDTMRGGIQISGDGVSDVGELLPPSPMQLVGGMATTVVSVVVGFAYILSKYFEEPHEP